MKKVSGFKIGIDRKVLGGFFVSVLLGAAAFALTLVLTVNMVAAVFVFTFFIAFFVFKKSSSRGWLFLFSVILLFPSLSINERGVTIYDIFLIVLAVTGFLVVILENFRILKRKFIFYFLFIFLIALAVIIVGGFFEGKIGISIWLTGIMVTTTWLIYMAFQYFFQTKKRIEYFFSTLVIVGVSHSLFGILAFIFRWQTSSGIGVSTREEGYFLFQGIKHQLNGLLGNEAVLRVGENILAILFLTTIPVTIGFLVNLSKNGKANFIIPARKKKKQSGIDLVSQGGKEKNLVLDLKTKDPDYYNKFFLFIFLIALQLIALFLTFSYVSFIIFGIGLFILGILLRNKKIILPAVFCLFFFSLIFPLTYSVYSNEQLNNFSSWTSDFDSARDWVLGTGWKMKEKIGETERVVIYNSYLYSWSTFGVFGFALLAFLLFKYFKTIHRLFVVSKEEERVWLAVIISIFFQFIILGFISNALFFGPAPLVFWLLFAVAGNIQKREDF